MLLRFSLQGLKVYGADGEVGGWGGQVGWGRGAGEEDQRCWGGERKVRDAGRGQRCWGADGVAGVLGRRVGV